MAIFKCSTTTEKPFNRKEIISEIKERVYEKYPNYHIIDNIEGEPWDLLIIRSITREVKQIIGAFNHEKVSQERFQQIYAIEVSNLKPSTDLLYLKQLQRISDWITLPYIYTDNAASIIRRLEEI